jgi:UDP-N-acetylmuramoylalanine--D-glutamate ligase
LPLDLRGKRVLVMGLGLHGGGLGVTRWLLKQGALVTVTDLKNAQELAPSLQALRGSLATDGTSGTARGTGSNSDAGIEFVLGEHRESDFTNADLIIRNPGVPRESHFLTLARQHHIPIRMEMGLFFEQLPRGGDQVVGITGTKGKTTTTVMVGAILKKANPKTVVAGNLRVSALELLDQIDADTPVVLELSSFQLEEFETLRVSPHLAAITNIYPDHLNRYGDLNEYAAAKANIFRHQGITDYCVLNFDNPALTYLRPRVPSRVVWFSRLRTLNDGAFIEREAIVWNDHGAKRRILPVTDMGLGGEHNVENALAATAVASVWGAAPEVIAEALREVKGVPHRLEVVRELMGVTYINDTTATAPVATVAALKALAGRTDRIILIAGGADKGLEYDEMAQAVARLRLQVILLQGNATPKVERALRAEGCGELIRGPFDRLEEAVKQAKEEASPGSIILLSPGAASFGMFANEFERGDKFREIVMNLE